ncbi:MAG: class I SAM-dependent RNA methyltransferase [Thalassobaculaceae bacterium]
MNKRRQKHKNTAKRFPNHTATIELVIDRIGGKGDGISNDPSSNKSNSVNRNQSYFIPGTLPGEQIIARPVFKTSEGVFGQLLEIKKTSTERVSAPCIYFGICGGCSLQHWNTAPYREWKIDRIKNAVKTITSPHTIFTKLITSQAQTRRRADLSIRRFETKSVLGFHERDSHRIVDIQSCHLLDPEIISLSNALRSISHLFTSIGESSRISINKLDNGLDILIYLQSEPSLEGLEAFNKLAHAHNLSRISMTISAANEIIPIIERKTPEIEFSGVKVLPPPGAFLQATEVGTQAITEAVLLGVAGTKTILELFSGCGTLTIPVHHQGTIHAVEGDALAADALKKAVMKAAIDRKISVEIRDLLKNPIPADELSRYDAIIFDPPRSGAKKQVEEIVKNGPTKVVAVSCNPNTFARDSKILVDGGYELKKITPIDQFLWSPHVELVAEFYREK